MFLLRIVIIIIAHKFDTQNYYCLNVSLAALPPQTVPKTHHLRTISKQIQPNLVQTWYGLDTDKVGRGLYLMSQNDKDKVLYDPKSII